MGEIDVSTARHVRVALIAAAGSVQPADVRADLAGITFIDAAGVGASSKDGKPPAGQE